MNAIRDWLSDNWLWLTVLAVVTILASLFFRGISRVSFILLAKSSICFNLAYLMLSLVFRNQLLPSHTPAFPALASILLWVQFALAGMASARIFDKICASEPGSETDVDNISIVNISIFEAPPLAGWKSITRGEWLWVVSVDACFVAMMVVLSFLRRLTFHP